MRRYVCFIILWLAGHANAAVIYTTADFGRTLATMDTSTGSTNVIGTFGPTSTYGNAFDLDGTLFATTSSNSLSTINKTTGTASFLGLLPEGMYSIEIDSSGNLYGLAWSGNLYNINKNTGSGILIGNTGIRSAMDLAFDSNDNLYATVGGILYEIDELTASVLNTTRISIGSSNMGIMFDEFDTMWATVHNSNSGLYTMDVNTGVATLQFATSLNGPHGGDIFIAATSVPEPSTLALLGLALLGARLRPKSN